jgi:hypothetical protein
MSVGAVPYRRSGFGVIVIAVLVLNGSRYLFNRFLSHGRADYAVQTIPKIVAYGVAAGLTLLLTLFLTPVFGPKDGTSLRSHLMRDHLFFVPVALWPLVFAALCWLSIRTKFDY